MFSKFHKIFDSLTVKERQTFQGALIIFLLSSLMNGANIFYKKTVLAPIPGGSYTEGVVGQPIAINPILGVTNDVDRDLIELTFSDVVELSKEIRTSADWKQWTLILKEEALWSDGERVSSDDVIFTIESIKNPDSHSPLAGTWQGVGVERISDSEIRFSLKTPYAFFNENLKTLKIVPQHIFGSIPLANLRLSDYNFEPIGSGPYAFLNYEKRKDGFITEYRFVANENYHGSKPLIKDLRFRFFPSYESAIDGFNKKEIDALGGLPSKSLDKIKVGRILQEIVIPRYYGIFFNPSTHTALKDKNVRRALTLLTDKDNIISKALSGKGIAINGPIYPGLEGFDPQVNELNQFSPEKAKELLDKNGWKRGEDGVLKKKIGQEEIRLDFELVVPDIDFLVETALAIKDSWEGAGVKLTLITTKPGEVTSDIIRTRNYHMIIFGNILKTSPDIFSFWHSSERFYPGLNLSIYENRSVDELLESIRRSLDEKTRSTHLKKLQATIVDDAPAIFLYSPTYLYAVPKDLGGFNSIFARTPANRFDNVEQWYLKTARVFK